MMYNLTDNGLQITYQCSVIGEPANTIPWKRKFKIRLDIGINGQPTSLTHVVEIPESSLLAGIDLIVKIVKVGFDTKPELTNVYPDINSAKQILEKIPITIRQSVSNYEKALPPFDFVVRVPLRNYPAEAEELGDDVHRHTTTLIYQLGSLQNHANSNSFCGYLATRKQVSNLIEPGYLPEQLAGVLDEFLDDWDDRMDGSQRLLGPDVCWIRGGIGRGKSTYIRQLRNLLTTGSSLMNSDKMTADDAQETNLPSIKHKWCVIDLSQLCYNPPITAKDLYDGINERLAKAIQRYGGSPNLYIGLNHLHQHDKVEAESVTHQLFSQIAKHVKGLIYILDEFDVLCEESKKFHDSNNGSAILKTPQDILTELLDILQHLPTEGNVIGPLPTILFIADHMEWERRLEEAWFDSQNYQVCTLELLSYYTQDDILSILRDDLLPPLKWNDDAAAALADRIWIWTRGHRGCVNTLLYYYYEYCKRNRLEDRQSEDWPYIDEVLADNDTEATIKASLKYLLDRATKELYDQVADGDVHRRIDDVVTDRVSSSECALLDKILHNNLEYQDWNSPEMKALAEKELVLREDGRPRIANQLLRFYWSQRDKSEDNLDGPAD